MSDEKVLTAAESLSKHKGGIDVCGLKNLSDAERKALANVKTLLST
jgi:hypothetical protein